MMPSGTLAASPLFLDGWLAFNQRKWGLTPQRLCLSPKGGELPSLETVIYLNPRGSVVQPRLTPHTPIAFSTTPTDHPARLTRQWLEVSDLLVAELQARGLRSGLTLPVGIVDVRSWQWAGYHIGVGYTFQLLFPHDKERLLPDLRRKLRKAADAGFRCARTEDMARVVSCLRATEARQGFDHGLTAADLEQALALLGPEHLRAYMCTTAEGEPVGANIVLHRPGGLALGWVMGTRRDFLSAGAAFYLLDHVIMDLQAAGATGLDMVGANMRSVAEAKLAWGCTLQPYYRIEPVSLRSLARQAVGLARATMAPAAAGGHG